MRYWLFQANPKTWDIDAFFRDGHELESFLMSIHADDISPGDRFVLWKAGPGGGVIGEGEITGWPESSGPDAADDYWARQPPAAGTLQIPLRVQDLWLDDPIPREQFLKDPILQESKIVKAPQSGNPFPLTPEQWNRLQQLLARTDDVAPSTWDLRPGEIIKRTELHQRYGGSGQSGITRSSSSPNVLIFTDPASGQQHGYFDDWGNDGCFYYSGEGQRGDQTLTGGNKAILEAAKQGRSLRVFKGAKGMVEYIGEFSLDPADPYIEVQAPETGGGPLRRVYQFRLWPIDTPGGTSLTGDKQIGAPYEATDEDVNVAPRAAPKSDDPDAYGRGLRLHRRTERELADTVTAQGLKPLRPSPTDPPFDLAWYSAENEITVVEVKSLTHANEAKQLRLGIGQILDYTETMRRRGLVVKPVLHLSHQPRDERWASICRRAGIELTWA